jgi:cation diffusion facilitator CzcD-associated flavoprotein CzcO
VSDASERVERVERVRVVIVGSGFAGLCMAIKLQEAGIDDYVILERADAIGGTWRDNHYPGCACDVPAHLYSFSFFPNPDWSQTYAPQPEIRAYIERCAAHYQLHKNVRFLADVTSAALDERAATWTVRTADGRTFVGDFLVSAIGGLSRPLLPSIPGIDRFAGRTWHSATWDHDAPLDGARVAVIGTGASAIQFVPQIAPRVAQLHLFQRTPPWILPRQEQRFSERHKRAFRHVPGVRAAHRARLYAGHELRALPFTIKPKLLEWIQPLALRYLHAQVTDPVLRKKLTPDYVMGCKRILISNDYYAALTRPNVDVITDGIREITRDGVVTADGREHPVDAIIYGTGFDVHDYIGGMKVIGRGGVDLGALWRSDPEAYLGTTAAGFPNLFTLIGPNTGLGHNSIIFMIESQVRLVMSCLAAMEARDAVTIEPRLDVQRAFNDEMQRRLGTTVWKTGCKSWYVNAAGKNTTLWPGFTVEFAARTARARAGDYVMRRRDELPAAATPQQQKQEHAA